MTIGTGYVDPAYLDAAARLAEGGKRLSYERMRLTPGEAALDVGCGPGTDTLHLAALVGPAGRVVGVDRDPEMIAEANRRAAAEGMDGFVDHQLADAAALPFADGSFDGVRSERLLLHVGDPGRVLAEMVRVTRTDGYVVVMDTDWGTRSVDSPEVDLERRFARVLAETCLVNGYSGRRLLGLARRAGLVELRVDPVPLVITDYGFFSLLSRMEMAADAALRTGALTAAELARLDETWRAMDDAGDFFALTTMVMVTGRKPPPSNPAPERDTSATQGVIGHTADGDETAVEAAGREGIRISGREA
ncbi:MAG TPA: methyltransferase domain-containing protein [Longimicrobiaceae bacterium]|nr:methyltransferase domain-containing protein [Longimicrobiaceae bacterium]